MSDEKPKSRIWRVWFSGVVYVQADDQDDAESKAWRCVNERARDVVSVDSCEDVTT